MARDTYACGAPLCSRCTSGCPQPDAQCAASCSLIVCTVRWSWSVALRAHARFSCDSLNICTARLGLGRTCSAKLMAYYFYMLRFSRREMPTSVVDAARNPQYSDRNGLKSLLSLLGSCCTSSVSLSIASNNNLIVSLFRRSFRTIPMSSSAELFPACKDLDA